MAREFAGRGLGRRVLDWAAGMARAGGKAYLRLDCMAANPRLRRYYTDAGFTDLGGHPGEPWFALMERRILE